MSISGGHLSRCIYIVTEPTVGFNIYMRGPVPKTKKLTYFSTNFSFKVLLAQLSMLKMYSDINRLYYLCKFISWNLCMLYFIEYFIKRILSHKYVETLRTTIYASLKKYMKIVAFLNIQCHVAFLKFLFSFLQFFITIIYKATHLEQTVTQMWTIKLQIWPS